PSGILTIENLPWQLTQPPGVRPSGILEKSGAYGRVGATRTRAYAIRPFALATTRPNCAGGALPTVSFVVVPLVSLSSPFIGGGGDAPLLGAGGLGKPIGNCGGSGPASDQSALTSPISSPLSS